MDPDIERELLECRDKNPVAWYLLKHWDTLDANRRLAVKDGKRVLVVGIRGTERIVEPQPADKAP